MYCLALFFDSMLKGKTPEIAVFVLQRENFGYILFASQDKETLLKRGLLIKEFAPEEQILSI